MTDLDDIDSNIFTVSENLFDYDSIVYDKIPGSVGSDENTFVDLSNWRTSNLMPVEAGEQYAIIVNGVITQNIIVRIAYYSNGVIVQKDQSNNTNPFTIPENVDSIRFYSNSTSPFASRYVCSIKHYTSSVTLDWKPYGKIENFMQKGRLQEFGVFVDGSNYYHFVQFGDKALIRLFKQEGPNNIFGFSALYVGNILDERVNIGETIATNGTDTIGPISIMRSGIDNGGRFAGGWHTITINNVSYPTAEQVSLNIAVNGESIIGKNGMHYGVCDIIVKNKLYYPQTITGADLSEATPAIEETVQYILDNKMTARVAHKYISDVRVILYYGMQAVRIGFDSIVLPNNEMAFAFADMEGNINLEKPESFIQLSNPDWIYDLTLKPFGLAKLERNEGTGATKYGYLPMSTRKVYWALIEGDVEHALIPNGKTLMWEGEWNIYPK